MNFSVFGFPDWSAPELNCAENGNCKGRRRYEQLVHTDQIKLLR
mgnify:CR=1 FL=1